MSSFPNPPEDPYQSPATAPPLKPIPSANTQTGMILGIISIVTAVCALPLTFCCCPIGTPLSIVAVGLGVAAILLPDGSGRTTGIIGAVMGALSILLLVVLLSLGMVNTAIRGGGMNGIKDEPADSAVEEQMEQLQKELQRELEPLKPGN
jgi:hypothetical protein